MEGVSSVVEVPRFRGIGSILTGTDENEAIIESRWGLPINVSFGSSGVAQEATCVIQAVERGEDGIFRYRIRIIGGLERSPDQETHENPA